MTNRIIKILMLISVLLYSFSATAKNSAHGWLWYDNPEKIAPQKNSKVNQLLTPVKTLSAEAQLMQFRKVVREAKAKAILVPTDENVANYIILQQKVIQQATRFSQVWQRVLLEKPSLDYNVHHPAESQGKKIIYSEDYQQQEKSIAMYRQHYGLFFFYRGDNPLDQAMSNTVLHFTQSEKIEIGRASCRERV